MRRRIYALSTVSVLILNGLAMSTPYASHATHKALPKTSTTPQAEPSVKPFNPYVSLSGGYGSFQSMVQGTGETAFARLALGVKSQWWSNISIGGEVGLQSARRMALGNQTVAPFFAQAYYPLPVYLTISPPVDVLASFTYHFSNPVFFEVKAGGVYMQSMIDQADISGLSQWNPELQLGVGFDISKKTRLVFNYQRFFGSTPRLKQIDLVVGTAALAHLPTWEAGMITLEQTF